MCLCNMDFFFSAPPPPSMSMKECEIYKSQVMQTGNTSECQFLVFLFGVSNGHGANRIDQIFVQG